jgi:hypothetical protein
MNNKYVTYIAGFFVGWSLLNIFTAIMKKEMVVLIMFAIPSLLASLGWVYSEYKRVFKEE